MTLSPGARTLDAGRGRAGSGGAPPLPAQRRGVCGGTRQGEARRSCRAGGTTDPREPAAASPPAQGSTQGRGAASRPPAGPRTPASPCTSCAVYFNHLPRGRHTWEDPVTRTRPCCSETSRTRGPRGHGWDSAPAAATAQRRALERVTRLGPLAHELASRWPLPRWRQRGLRRCARSPLRWDPAAGAHGEPGRLRVPPALEYDVPVIDSPGSQPHTLFCAKESSAPRGL